MVNITTIAFRIEALSKIFANVKFLICKKCSIKKLRLLVVSDNGSDSSPILPSLSITATVIVYSVFEVNPVISVLVLPSVTSLMPSLSGGIHDTLYPILLVGFVVVRGAIQLIDIVDDVVKSDKASAVGLAKTETNKGKVKYLGIFKYFAESLVISRSWLNEEYKLLHLLLQKQLSKICLLNLSKQQVAKKRNHINVD